MAIILRGKRKGESIKIHQFANDWIMGDCGTIFSPTSIELESESELAEMKKHGTLGMFWDLYEVKNLRFVRRKGRRW